MQKDTLYPRLLVALVAAFLAHASWGQCTATSDPNCAVEVVYYLDLDGDGFGVDDAEWNRYCCSGTTPSEMYTTVAGDIRPHDPMVTTELIEGCTFSEACNYNAAATIYDGSCLFPIPGCRSCALPLTTDGTGSYNPDDPCDCSGDVDLYVDALGYCGGDCVIDADGDGLCDCTTDADGDGQCDCATTDDNGNCLTYTDQVDPCWVAGESLDDCGNCRTSATARTFTIDGVVGGIPCFPGDPNCMDASGKCNCEDEELNSCGVCGAPEPAPGFDCDNDFTCLSDTIPIGGNGICDLEDIIGCRNSNACNFNPDATYGDDSVLCGTEDECGICDGQGIPTGACPCDTYPSDGCECYTYPAPGYQCNGDCVNDADGDGVCDEFEVLGCTDAEACNFDANATEADLTQCNYLDALFDCGGSCAEDVDEDGVCDNVDDCVGTKDICGVCNGSGIPDTACDCLGNTLDALDNCGGGCLIDSDSDGVCDLDIHGNVADDFICDGVADALGVCNGTCTADSDEDGICDDVDDCIGYVDACGTCNGPGIPAEIAIATEISLMQSMCAVDRAKRMPMGTGFAMITGTMVAMELWTNAAFATAREFRKVIAIAKETKKISWAIAGETAFKIWTETEFVIWTPTATSWTVALEQWMNAEYAMVQVLCPDAVANPSTGASAIATEMYWMYAVNAAAMVQIRVRTAMGIASRIRMVTESAMPWTHWYCRGFSSMR